MLILYHWYPGSEYLVGETIQFRDELINLKLYLCIVDPPNKDTFLREALHFLEVTNVLYKNMHLGPRTVSGEFYCVLYSECPLYLHFACTLLSVHN